MLFNTEHREILVSRSNDSFNHSPFLRQVFTDRTKNNPDEPAKVWKFLSVPGLENTYRIQNEATGEFLIASSFYSRFDDLRRRTFGVISDYPQIFSDDPIGHWVLINTESGTVLRNRHYHEFLYAAAQNFALDEERRSVFTWKLFQSLGPNGYWIFRNQRFLSEEGRPLTPGRYVITNYRRREPLKAEPDDFDSTRGAIFTDRFANSDQSSDSWLLIRISGSDYCYKIQNSRSGAYLIAGSDREVHDPYRRRVFVTSRESGEASTCSGDDEWNITKHPDGYLIQNRKCSEFIYAAADDLALDDKRRSVFAWKTLYDLGTEGIWLFARVQ